MDMFDHVWGKLLAELDVTDGLRGFDRPVFLALGRYDYLVAPPSSWESVAPQFEDLEIRVYEKSGHTPPYEEPSAFDADLLDWMKRIPSKT
jgi:proline iminopeptidase